MGFVAGVESAGFEGGSSHLTKSEFFAHKEHRLADHLNKVGRKAAEFAMAFGGAEHASITGLLHNLGKVEQEFQKRLRSDDKEGDKQPHAHHGAMIALEKEAWLLTRVLPLQNSSSRFARRCGAHSRSWYYLRRIAPKLSRSSLVNPENLVMILNLFLLTRNPHNA